MNSSSKTILMKGLSLAPQQYKGSFITTRSKITFLVGEDIPHRNILNRVRTLVSDFMRMELAQLLLTPNYEI